MNPARHVDGDGVCNIPFVGMRTHGQIISDAAGPAAVAKRISVRPGTVKQWRRLDSIPAAHWNAIVAAKLATLKELADAAEARRIRPDNAPEPANDTGADDPDVRQAA